jgi:hypothetical protein
MSDPVESKVRQDNMFFPYGLSWRFLLSQTKDPCISVSRIQISKLLPIAEGCSPSIFANPMEHLDHTSRAV